MTRYLKSFALAAVAFAVTIALAGAPANLAALAQTAPPAVAAPLAEGTVRALQEALNKQGITVAVDGTLSEQTRAAIRTYQSQHHLPVTGEPDKATLDKLGVGAQQDARRDGQPPAGQAPAAGQGTGGPGMGGPGMMGDMGMPEGGMGSGMMGTPHGGMGGGMMGMGAMPMMGGMPMHAGMTMCPMMHAMMHPMMGGMMGMSPHAMAGMGTGPGMMYGLPSMHRGETTLEGVKAMAERMLAAHGHRRLKLGEVRATAYGEFLVDIVTQEDSLVHRLAVDRRTGALRQVE